MGGGRTNLFHSLHNCKRELKRLQGGFVSSSGIFSGDTYSFNKMVGIGKELHIES